MVPLTLRPVQDYQKLNVMTIKNHYPLPLISEVVHKLHQAHIFTRLDIRWGYNNICVKEGNEHKEAFVMNRGLYKPLVVFFGLMKSSATFQTMMNGIFCELKNDGHVIIYMDDIIIFTQDLEEHKCIVKHVLETLQQHNLYLNLRNCLGTRQD